jgi:hypothetical protein
MSKRRGLGRNAGGAALGCKEAAWALLEEAAWGYRGEESLGLAEREEAWGCGGRRLRDCMRREVALE